MHSVNIKRLIKDMDVEVIYQSKDNNINITQSDINRPGLQLAGYIDFFAEDRIQIIGNVEWHYLQTLDEELKFKRLEYLFSKPIPALVVTRSLEITEEALDLAKKYDRTILRSSMSTSKFINNLIIYLDDMLAPSTTMHGVLVDVYGVGVLIVGKSGVGKSETALELIKRGHRLISDDAVDIKRKEEGNLKGTAPELIRHFLEIRGIGILDIKRLFGVGSVRNSKTIDLVIELEYWDEKKEYDRTGLDEEYTDILGTKMSKIIVPVKPGRNISMIVEVAARNYRQKKMGYNAALELNNKLMNQINK
ncbi:MAG: HPr(Ser) kinase/phosphatase [Senegalia sp. (in: firmicutes)]|uniref:HPr(Ser) kinase/phosphatase n=1 Tax=Senegalia sp. (in: firmicutes) TaxID=1924098 RepID=UPI003F9E0ABB